MAAKVACDAAGQAGSGRHKPACGHFRQDVMKISSLAKSRLQEMRFDATGTNDDYNVNGQRVQGKAGTITLWRQNANCRLSPRRIWRRSADSMVLSSPLGARECAFLEAPYSH